MEDPERDIQGVLEVLLTTDSAQSWLTTREYFTDDAEFHHPFFILRGKVGPHP
jgi:hypothetical protein